MTICFVVISSVVRSPGFEMARRTAWMLNNEVPRKNLSMLIMTLFPLATMTDVDKTGQKRQRHS